MWTFWQHWQLGRGDFRLRLLLPLSNCNFWGLPLSQVSVVLPSANNVVNAFLCFVLSQLFRQALSKHGCEINILVIFFNFCHSFTTSINLHATSTFFMLDNELQRTIYTIAPIIISMVQYFFKACICRLRWSWIVNECNNILPYVWRNIRKQTQLRSFNHHTMYQSCQKQLKLKIPSYWSKEYFWQMCAFRETEKVLGKRLPN